MCTNVSAMDEEDPAIFDETYIEKAIDLDCVNVNEIDDVLIPEFTVNGELDNGEHASKLILFIEELSFSYPVDYVEHDGE